MEIVSGRTGKPHVTSQQFRQLIEGTVGQEKLHSDIRRKFGTRTCI